MNRHLSNIIRQAERLQRIQHEIHTWGHQSRDRSAVRQQIIHRLYSSLLDYEREVSHATP